MIVEVDFLEHWKTQMLIDLLDDPAAPCYLLRLWAHCHQRKVCRFEAGKLTPPILRAITHTKIEAQALWEAFVSAGFLDLQEGGIVEAHGFYDANASLFACWENGKKGGRPPKNKKLKNPSGTQPKPIEEGEKAEEKEETEKQDGGEDPSSPPGKKSFWHRRDYSSVEEQTVEEYADIRVIEDPIEAAMVVCGDYKISMYGFLVKGCGECLSAGLSTDSIREFLFSEVEKMFGIIKSDERKKGKDACKTFVAIMREYFKTVGKPSV